jgi:RecA/RadA recombinase
MAKFNDLKGTDFSNIFEYAKQFSPDISVLESRANSDIPEFIHSGSYYLNLLLSGDIHGGFAGNKIMTIMGDPKTGKSFLAKNLIKNAQINGYIPWVMETEGAYTVDSMLKFGIDTSKVLFNQPETAVQVQEILMPFTEGIMSKRNVKGFQIPKILFVIDSISGLMSNKQIKDAINQESANDMGFQAREVKTMLNMISTRLDKLGMGLIATAHVYEETIQGTNQKRRKANSGTGSVYFSSNIIDLTKKIDKDKDKDEDGLKKKRGVHVNVNTVENRFCPMVDGQLYISFEKGMNPYYGLQKYISKEVCGIYRGKMVNYIDLAYKLISKKAVTLEDLLTKEFNYVSVKEILNKDEKELFFNCFKYYIEKEEIFLPKNQDVDDTPVNEIIFYFTSKIYERLKKNFSPEIKMIGIPNEKSNEFVVDHLNESLQATELFTSRVFTNDILSKINNSVRKIFNFSNSEIPEEIVEDENI